MENSEIRNKFSGQILPGVEIKAICNNHNIEVLGYGIDTNKIKIYKCENLQELMLEHFKEVADKYEIKYDKNLKIGKENVRKWASFTFAENILKNKENIDKLDKLGEKYLTEANFCRKCEINEKSIFYFNASKYVRNINDVIDDIHDAGGLAFFAHAYEYRFEDTKKEIENIMKTTSIDGFECQHSIYSEEQKKEIIQLCKKYNKYMSGGSDYHAKNKPDIKIGTGRNNLHIDKEFVENWIKVLPKI